ncbi:uncharacterized protein [Drosophila takahashii]|uniref:uncharacterized protein n=1 Tax=Drosophila takahashii TaxID=29030 RepID=UPI001CF7F74F|nr:uncharacterized protein LOC108062115 [Drosophila takahashii]
MDKTNSSLLPYIMDMLSRQPQLCATTEDLMKSIKDIVLDEHIGSFGSLERAVEFALEVGVSLGILSLTDHQVRLPFNFRKRSPRFQVPAASRISPLMGRRAIRQRVPKATAAKLMGKKKPGPKVVQRKRRPRKPAPSEIPSPEQ